MNPSLNFFLTLLGGLLVVLGGHITRTMFWDPDSVGHVIERAAGIVMVTTGALAIFAGLLNTIT